MSSKRRASEGQGRLLTFEGIEGSGKSIQIRRAEEYLRSRDVPCLLTREPGGTAFGKAVRQVLLRKDRIEREPVSELLLYLADRYQHQCEVIRPALQRGLVVLSDRYHDATRAYQGVARGIPLELIDRLAEVLQITDPDGTLLLDLAPEVGLERARRRNEAKGASEDEGRFEDEALSFHRAVREAYLEMARRSPGRFRVVDGSGSEDEVFQRIRLQLDGWIGEMGR